METSTRTLSILIADASTQHAQELTLILSAAGMVVAGNTEIHKLGTELEEKHPDLLLITIQVDPSNPEASELMLHFIKKLTEEFTVPIITIVQGADNDYIYKLADSGVHGILPEPLSKENLISAIEIACYQSWLAWQDIQEIEKLKSTIETRDLSSQAKQILMKHFGMNENAAYIHMREKCRNQQKTIDYVSKEIINAESLLIQRLGKD